MLTNKEKPYTYFNTFRVQMIQEKIKNIFKIIDYQYKITTFTNILLICNSTTIINK